MPKPQTTEILEWLNDQLLKAKSELRARVDAEKVWRTGSDKSWRSVAQLTGSGFVKKSERHFNAERESRIAEKCRRDVDMLEAIIERLK
jgi:hypothetical protein